MAPATASPERDIPRLVRLLASKQRVASWLFKGSVRADCRNPSLLGKLERADRAHATDDLHNGPSADARADTRLPQIVQLASNLDVLPGLRNASERKPLGEAVRLSVARTRIVRTPASRFPS